MSFARFRCVDLDTAIDFGVGDGAAMLQGNWHIWGAYFDPSR